MIQRVSSAKQINTVVALAHEIWHEHFPSVITVGQIDYMLGKFLCAPAIQTQIQGNYEYGLLLDESGAQGFFAIEPQADHRLFLSKLYVRRQARGAGLASEAMAYMQHICRKHHLNSIWLTVNIRNDLAVSVYKHLGFKVVDTQVKDIRQGYVMDDYIMENGIDI
ncbi:MAG: GNAT family N-acetyltransferase [Planctomycetes bacterium]|nr:GNAT family N-acetyltransferase [Planctomycetota bacterium]